MWHIAIKFLKRRRWRNYGNSRFGFRNLGVCVLVVSVFRAGGFRTRNRSQCGVEKEERKRTFNRRTCHRNFSDRVFDDYDVYCRRCNGYVTFFRVRIVVFTTKASNRVVGSGLFLCGYSQVFILLKSQRRRGRFFVEYGRAADQRSVQSVRDIRYYVVRFENHKKRGGKFFAEEVSEFVERQ